MSLKEFCNHIRLRNHTKGAQVLRGLYSTEEFRAILERERARANRNGHEFSLVVFDVSDGKGDSTCAQRIADGLKGRLRATDELGWFDNLRLGVVLPYTAPEGAWKVAEDCCQRIATGAWCPTYTVYAYPSRWMAGGDGHDLKRRFTEISP